MARGGTRPGAGRKRKISTAISIEDWPIDRPKPYGRNPRKIPEKAVRKVARSIQEFGFRQPIVVDDKGVILAGHTRLQAARSLNLETVPVHVARGLSAEQARAFRLADNRVAEETGWDIETLNFELDDLKALDFDLSSLGFEKNEYSIPDSGASDQSNKLVPHHEVLIICKSEHEQAKLLKRLMAEGLECRALTS